MWTGIPKAVTAFTLSPLFMLSKAVKAAESGFVILLM